jgi:hypothetical protein
VSVAQELLERTIPAHLVESVAQHPLERTPLMPTYLVD